MAAIITPGTNRIVIGSPFSAAQMLRPGGGVAAAAGPYDDTPNIVAAFGMRLLLSDYSGAAVRIRRSSNNDELDFGFDENGDLDTAAISTFLGGSLGYAAKQYDQSIGGNHLVMATTAVQPLYVENGQNGKPTLRFDGADNHLLNSTTNLITAGAAYSVLYAAVASAAVGGAVFTLRRTGKYSASMVLDGAGLSYIHGDGVTAEANVRIENPTSFKSTFFIGAHIYAGAGVNPAFFVNGASESVVTPTTGQTTEDGNTGFFVGRSGAGQYWPGDIAELVVADAAWSAGDRGAAETIANDYWAVY